MFKNYLTITFRNVLKHKIFSFINVAGLGIGLAACMLILQFVMFELSYDKFFDNYDRIYRVTNDRFQQGKLIQHGTIMYPTIGPAMAADFQEVESYTRLMPAGELDVKVDDKFFKGEDCFFADEHFLKVFSFPLLAGERATALDGRYKILLTATAAKRYFQLTDNNINDALGKALYWGLDKEPYIVTAVCADIPENSHIQFGALVSYKTLITPEQHGADDSWTWSDMRHYLVLKPGQNYKTLESKFEDFSQRHFQGDKVSGSVEKFYLQPLSRAHLYSDYEYDIAKVASGKAVWAMLIVAGFILLIAWINYINLTTSRALERAKEVGLRKVMGAIRGQLVGQFLVESMVISLFAFVLAILLTALLQGSFNQIIGGNLSPLSVINQMDTGTIVIVVSVMMLGVLLAGFYPAVVLSSYQPITVLKGKFQRSSRGNILRKGLVVFQFMASAALITGTLIVSRQLKFMNEADLGINISKTIVVSAPERTEFDSTFVSRIDNYEHALASLPGVVSATTSQNVPGGRLGRVFDVRPSDQPSGSHVSMSFMGVDYNFLNSYSIPVLAGRGFRATDHHVEWDNILNVIMNVNAIKLLGFSNEQEALGQKVDFWDKKWTIIGVIPDFHQQALKRPMEPILLFPIYSNYARTSVKVNTENTKEVLAGIEATFNKFFPANSFDYFFLEDYYNTQYRDDNRFSTVVNIFAVLAIIISCLGLIGLSSYIAIQRTKEIGIRKVLGASTTKIVSLLSLDFIKLIAIASVLALPLAYFSLTNWLQAYAYRISLGWPIFILPVVMILAIAAITMSFQVIRTARTNPATTLKHE